MLKSLAAPAGILCFCVVSALSPVSAESVLVVELYAAGKTAGIPILHGEKVFYEGYAKGAYRFYSVDITKKTRVELRSNTAGYLWPYDFGGTHGGWITYAKAKGGGKAGGSMTYKVQMINAATKVTSDVISDGSYKDFMAMDDQSIAWTDYRHSAAADTFNEVYCSSLKSISPVRISTAVSYKTLGAVQGNFIVWQDYRNAGSSPANADIYLYDMGGAGERAICTNGAYQDHPAVHSNTVVWQDFRNAGKDKNNGDIYRYDLVAKKEYAVCTAPGYQAHPKVWGDYIVWHDYRNKNTKDSLNADIYLYEISTKTEIAVTTKAGYQGPPSIYKRTIVWHDATDGKIYFASISKDQGTTVLTPATTLQTRASHHKAGLYDLLGKRVCRNKAGHHNTIVIQAGREKESASRKVLMP